MILDIIVICISVGALSISIIAYRRTKNIERPTISIEFGNTGNIILRLKDYSTARNLRVDRVGVKPLRDSFIANLFTFYTDLPSNHQRFLDKISPPILEIYLTTSLNPMEGYKFKIHTNYKTIKHRYLRT